MPGEGLAALAAAQREDRERLSQAQWLIGCARQHGTLWHTPEREPYITYLVDGHREHAPIRTRYSKDWLRRAYYAEHGRPPGAQALQDAVDTLAAMAVYDGPEAEAHVRLAGDGGAIYLDLCDDDWQAVEVTPNGWRMVAEPPVRFRRARGMLPLPVPVTGGSVDELRDLWPGLDDDAWVLVASWLVMALCPRGPYPVLILHGEQGSGKSTLARMLRGLVDPSTAPLRTTPREERDLVIAARNGRVIALDNLSGAPVWLSDALCRLATGGGWSTRELYTDTDEVLIDAQRPILLTGIDEIATRDDLRDRALIVTLPTMSDTQRIDEADLWDRYERIRPRVLGALLDSVSMALRRWEDVRLPLRPRMADYARWIAAAEPALGWSAYTHLRVYSEARRDAASASLESSPVAQAVLSLIERRGTWEGTATDLLESLEEHVPDRVLRDRRQWPQSPRALSGRLRRVAPVLRHAGIEIDMTREPHTGRRLIQITAASDRHDRHHRRGPRSDGHLQGDGRVTVGDGARVLPSPTGHTPLTGSDDGDDADADSRTQSTGVIDL